MAGQSWKKARLSLAAMIVTIVDKSLENPATDFRIFIEEMKLAHSIKH